MMRPILILQALLIYCTAHAQFNDSINYYVSYAPTGIINRTNDGSSYVLSNVLKLNFVKKIVSLNSTSSWLYGQQEDRLINNDFSSTLDFNLYRNVRRLYYWGLANYDKSFSLKIIDRLQIGAGGAYNVIDRKNVWLNISDGILYEFSDLYVTADTRDKYQTFRNSLRLRYRWVIKEIIVFDGTNFLQNSLSDKEDYIIKSVNSLSVKLKKWLSFNASLNYNKLNRTDRENLLITYGIVLEKYF